MQIEFIEVLRWIGFGAMGGAIVCGLLLGDKKRILKAHHHKSNAPYLKKTFHPPLHSMTRYGFKLVSGFWGCIVLAVLCIPIPFYIKILL